MERKGSTKLEFKVGNSGWVSVYWGSRFPCTLPGEVWERLLKEGNREQVLEFVKEQRAAGNLSEKESIKPVQTPENGQTAES